MLTLMLLRHAKSGWDDPRLKDFERPLAERGLRAAPLMGAYMAREALLPDLVLSSPSVRTRETCRLAFEAFAKAPEIRFEDVLYLASPQSMLRLIRNVPDSVRRLMLVGHNPGLQALALDLIGSGPKKARADLAKKLPTASLVVIELDAPNFAAIDPAGSGRLERFVTPKMLAS